MIEPACASGKGCGRASRFGICLKAVIRAEISLASFDKEWSIGLWGDFRQRQSIERGCFCGLSRFAGPVLAGSLW